MRERIRGLFSKDKAKVGNSNSSEPAVSESAGTFPSGIKLWYNHEASIVDIVFIHGLTGHREKTWTAEGADSPWPQTLLPFELPTSRVLTYGYDAGVVDWKSVVSESRVRNHAWNLLQALALYRDRDDTNHRPILFALVIARQRLEPHLLDVLHSTRGIAFLGTPHHGSGLAQWAERLCKYTGVIKQVNSNIVKVLKQDSEVLAGIQDGFHTLVRARQQDKLPEVEMTCFFEELPLPIIGLVVSQHSATLPGYPNVGIRSNHMNMCRFVATVDPGFISVCGELRRWAKQLSATEQRPDNSPSPSDIDGYVKQERREYPVRHCLVPYLANPDFVGRTTILDQLRQEQSRMGGQFQIRVAIYGLGGIGKTQIAISYIFRLREEYPDMSIFWVHASSVERFRQAYDSIAEECEIQGRNDPKEDILLLVKKWLESKASGQWFMVIDNADDAQIFNQSIQPMGDSNPITPGQRGGLSRYIPECAHGAILITTRNKQVGAQLTRGSRLIEVGKMNDNESGELLATRLGGSHDDTDTRMLLASRLEHLPLALDQAAAFIQENSIGVDDYLQLLGDSDQHLASLLSEDFEAIGRESNQSHAVATTWILTFEQIQRQNVFASELLSFMCLLDRQAIPFDFLSAFSKVQGIDEGLHFTKALGLLKAFSLIAEETSGSFSMHRLVQLITQNWLNAKKTTSQFEKQALLIVSEKYPYGGFGNRAKCSAYLPHAQRVLKLVGTGSSQEALAKASIYHCVGSFFDLEGHWADAEKYQIQAIDIRARLLGENDPDTLNSISDLAWTYVHQGRWNEAESRALQVMEKREARWGRDYPDTLTSIANLSSVYWNQGRWEEAESLELEVMEKRQAILGSDHTDTLTSMTNLASVYAKQGRWAEAEPLMAQVMDKQKAISGLNHPKTLSSMANLASVYFHLGRWKEAELMEVELSEKGKTVWGPDHPKSLLFMNNLAETYRNQGRWNEAESLGVELVEKRRRILGPDHPDTLISMNNLALVYRSQERWEEAVTLATQVMDKNSNLLGPEHPDTLISMNNLAEIYKSQGRLEEAESLGLQLVEKRKRILGPNHPQTIAGMNNLASTYRSQGRLKDAESLQMEAMDMKKLEVGPDHPETLTMMNNLAFIWYSQGRHRDAVDLMTECYELRVRVIGPDHPYTQSSLSNLEQWREQLSDTTESRKTDSDIQVDSEPGAG
ncbi:hypothetical protein GGR50DRAFT_704951 [Xylaria sp. CBS 124048]|nr:hypothetical protein GGR50DRAFT_704951 [Xylaria sp. CBS 124048]